MQKKYLPIALVLIVLLALLAFLGVQALETVPAISLAEEAQNEVYLTFDDGPSTVVTERILDILSEEGVKATFFIVSDRAYGRESTLKRIVAEGHTVGVHSASHDYAKIYASDEALIEDVQTCARRIQKITGVTPTVYRFPGGGSSARERQTKLVEGLGYRVVFWNAACGDAEIPHASAEELCAETIKTSHGKRPVVLLMHDSASHKATATALPHIIAYYKEQGCVFRQF